MTQMQRKDTVDSAVVSMPTTEKKAQDAMTACPATIAAWLKVAFATTIKGAIIGLLCMAAFSVWVFLSVQRVDQVSSSAADKYLERTIPLLVACFAFGAVLGFFYAPLPRMYGKAARLAYSCLAFLVALILAVLVSFAYQGTFQLSDGAILFTVMGATVMIFVTALSQLRGQLDDPISVGRSRQGNTAASPKDS